MDTRLQTWTYRVRSQMQWFVLGRRGSAAPSGDQRRRRSAPTGPARGPADAGVDLAAVHPFRADAANLRAQNEMRWLRAHRGHIGVESPLGPRDTHGVRR